MTVQNWLNREQGRPSAPSHEAEARERNNFVKGLATDFAALRADPKAWAEELAEREAWDATNSDGLEDE